MGELGDRLEKLVESKIETKAREIAAGGGSGGGSRWESRGVLSDGRPAPALGDPRGTSLGNRGIIHQRGEDGVRLGRLLQSIVRKDRTLAPAEWAMSERLEKAGYAPSFGGCMIPWSGGDLYLIPGHEQEIERLVSEVKQMLPFATPDEGELRWLQRKMHLETRAMEPLDETAGGSLIPFPMFGDTIQLLRPMPVVTRAGARVVSIAASGSSYMPAETAGPTFAWVPPNTTISTQQGATGAVTLSAKRAVALIKFANDFRCYGASAMELFVRNSLVRGAELVEDAAFLEGSGGTGVPAGILTYPRSVAETPTIGKITLHVAGGADTNGDVLVAEDILTMLALIEEGNDAGATAWICRPLYFAAIANQRTDAITTGDARGPFLFPITRGALGNAVAKEMGGIPVLTSTQVSKTHHKGNSDALTYLLSGNFGQCVIGRVGAVEIALSDQAGFEADQTWVRAVLRTDMALAHPESFCVTDQLVMPS
jgi:HK97 family phage major capsid protein